jgi:glycosyltransferase involved in cell wall biosynthesis
VKALQKCKERHPDLEVVLFGPTSRFRPPGLPDWADYKGNIPQRQLTRLFNESKIYVCSSVAEGFALPPAEAMACGCAVAATDCGGIREFARDGVNILLSPTGDPDRLAENILRLLDNDPLRVSLANAGRESISRFTWSKAADQLETFIAANAVNDPLYFVAAERAFG